MNIYKLPLILEPQPEGGYTITCPLLPNLITEADTFAEILPHVTDALAALIEAYQDLQKPSKRGNCPRSRLGTERFETRNITRSCPATGFGLG